MDYVLMKYYPDNVLICGDTYESLIWKNTTDPKPSEEELNLKWQELKKEHMWAAHLENREIGEI